MLSQVFIASFAKFLNLTSIVLISDNETRDEDMDALTWMSIEIGMSVHVIRTPDEENTTCCSDSLLFDPSRFYQKVSDKKNWFKEDMYWLVSNEAFEAPRMLRLDSNFFTITHQEHSVIAIQEWYRIKTVLYATALGFWSYVQGLQVKTPLLYERRSDLHGLLLNVATIVWDPYVINQRETTKYQGLVPEIIHYIQKACNFSTTWSIEASGSYGTPEGNGSWNGLIGRVQRREVDVIAAMLSVKSERSAVVSYAHVFFQDKATLIILDPNKNKHNTLNWHSFLKVCTSSAWILLFTGLLLIFIGHLTILTTKETGLLTGITSSLAFIYTSFLQLDCRFMGTTTLSHKILILSTVSYSLIAMVYIEGMLFSLIITKERPYKLRSFADTIEHGYQVMVTHGTSYVLDLELAPAGSGRRLVFEDMMKDNPDAYYTFTTFEDMREILLRQQKSALYTSSLVFLGDPDLLTLTQLDDALNDPLAFALQKDSELLGLINYQVVKLHQSGMLHFLKHKWINSRRPDLWSCGMEEALALGYDHLAPYMLVLVFGIFVAALAVAGEAAMSRTFNRNKKYKKNPRLQRK